MSIPFTDPVEDVCLLWREGESKRIDACYKMVQENCNTADVAKRLGLDTDTVNKMQNAGKMYRNLLEKFEDLAQDAHESLTYSHLALVYRYVSVEVLNEKQAWRYLSLAISENLSTRKLDEKIRVDFNLIHEPDFKVVVGKYIKKLRHDLIDAPFGGLGSTAAHDFASKNVRPAAENLLDVLEQLQELCDA